MYGVWGGSLEIKPRPCWANTWPLRYIPSRDSAISGRGLGNLKGAAFSSSCSFFFFLFKSCAYFQPKPYFFCDNVVLCSSFLFILTFLFNVVSVPATTAVISNPWLDVFHLYPQLSSLCVTFNSFIRVSMSNNFHNTQLAPLKSLLVHLKNCDHPCGQFEYILIAHRNHLWCLLFDSLPVASPGHRLSTFYL